MKFNIGEWVFVKDSVAKFSPLNTYGVIADKMGYGNDNNSFYRVQDKIGYIIVHEDLISKASKKDIAMFNLKR